MTAAGRNPAARYRSPAHRAALAVLRSADYLRRVVGPVVEAEGLTLQQFNVLRILRGAGKDGLPTLEIGERMIEQAPGVTRLLDRLEAKGLVHRERCPRDRRQVTVCIADAGRTALARLDGPVAQAEERALGVLSTTEIESITRSLERFHRADAGTETGKEDKE